MPAIALVVIPPLHRPRGSTLYGDSNFGNHLEYVFLLKFDINLIARQWESQSEGLHIATAEGFQRTLAVFPPPDLCNQLISLYFRHINSQLPLLHQPTFERQWKDKLHEKNIWFTGLVLSLFAVASPWSDDPRVLPRASAKDEDGDVYDWSKAGRDYFDAAIGLHNLDFQVETNLHSSEDHRIRRSLFYPATLFEVQAVAVKSIPANSLCTFD